MIPIFTVTILALAATVTGQHHGLTDPSTSLATECYVCDDDKIHNFPMCLNHPVKCHSGQVCRIRYGYRTDWHIPHIHCVKEHDCTHQLQGHFKQCLNGGIEVDREVCQLCCTTSSCVANVTSVLRLELMASKNLFCPGKCDINKLSDCIDTGRVCDRLDFCQVRIDHGHKVTGKCVDDHQWTHCGQELARIPCPSNFTDASAYEASNSGHCYHDCCATNECLFQHFGIHMANASIPTGPYQPSTNEEVGSSLWEQLRGSCRDQFDLALCKSLKNDHDVCHSRLSLSMCPETCGICSAVNSSVCRDTTDVCEGKMAADPDFCKSDFAVFSCPKSCKKCDKLIDSIVTSIITGSSTATNVPIAASTTAMMNTVNCDDLDTVSCDNIIAMCDSTFLKVVCPDKCLQCV